MSNSNVTGTDKELTQKQKDRAQRKAEFKEIAYEMHVSETNNVLAKLRKDANQMIPEYRTGRPKEFNDRIKEEMLERLANGQNLKDICRLKHMPSPVTVYAELEKDRIFSNLFTRARLSMADTLFDECLSICDDDSNDLVKLDDGSTIVNHAKIQRDKLRVDTRLRIAGKLNPKRYSDKLLDSAANVTVNNNSVTINARDMSATDRDKLRTILLAAKENNTIDHE
jgi:hypothetical protein